MTPELRAAIMAAQAAGRIQRRRFRREHQIEMKADNTPVTMTDRDSQAAIRRVLQSEAPGYGFLSEEEPDALVAAARGPLPGVSRWIVDPLDGTKKFVRGLPFFGPSIALERDGELVLGVIHLPAFRETLWAERGGGAYSNGQPIRVSDHASLARAYVVLDNEVEFYRRGWSVALNGLVTAIYHNPGFLDLYSYAALASGRVDALIMVGEAPWDIAAARVIVEEAGGRLTDFQGQPTVYSGTTVATNGILHPTLVRMVEACRYRRKDIGSTGVPPARASKCRWGPVLSPVLPTEPMRWPAITR